LALHDAVAGDMGCDLGLAAAGWKLEQDARRPLAQQFIDAPLGFKLIVPEDAAHAVLRGFAMPARRPDRMVMAISRRSRPATRAASVKCAVTSSSSSRPAPTEVPSLKAEQLSC